jgi:deazaflavin-dependent oxidoreductase (nitroreductase family)
MISWIKAFMALHRFLYQITNGLLGSRILKHRFLLLHTLGRKSGETYITPLSYFRDGENFILVASNWGMTAQADWYLNLIVKPFCWIQVGRKQIPVKAVTAEESEYERLWELVTDQNRQYLRYQQVMERQIPIMILTPIISSGP